ncbi:unnamed protein product (macronuclear) [Paramecium tetraurelia]|uniref:Uncharacterized protein n=1 Tax=Paramecium tetraurelia TaxID=5888 RepID=A0DWJ4_PARTE|nr:uncharacterized protein GSPATT00021054001 [Paramecium tetraurelia]CAK87411.1 unnamed protein product [Paramecium tetraurelia]|eukprot:XP_001454808.1 hypothetical protein (macronuclear) [Paramecium tetraurelia strain d4-2]
MISFWNDQETNNYYLINNKTGEKQRVYKTGDYIKEFDPSLTGRVGFKQRLKLALKPSYLPAKAKSLQSRFTYYTPKGNKFLWYSQCPRPKQLPNLEHFTTTNKSFMSQTQRDKQFVFPVSFSKNQPQMKITTGISNYQSLLEPEQFQSMQNAQNLDLNNEQHYKDMSNLFDSKSYDYKSFNKPPKSNLNCRSIKEFEQILKEEEQQLEMFKLPSPTKQLINTKGRFPLQLKTSSDFVKEDKMITKLLQPELFKEKVTDQKQDELRRRINKYKEQEMLARNLKNKV